ncbi:Khsrp [Symbiodinium sp. CCMP2592]|nr:Khsrp [Symbiodinium sp. CCMP2592]
MYRLLLQALILLQGQNALAAWVIDLSPLEPHACRNLAEAATASQTALCGLQFGQSSLDTQFFELIQAPADANQYGSCGSSCAWFRRLTMSHIVNASQEQLDAVKLEIFQNLDDASAFAANSARAKKLEASLQTWKSRKTTVQTQRSFVVDGTFNESLDLSQVGWKKLTASIARAEKASLEATLAKAVDKRPMQESFANWKQSARQYENFLQAQLLHEIHTGQSLRQQEASTNASIEGALKIGDYGAVNQIRGRAQRLRASLHASAERTAGFRVVVDALASHLKALAANGRDDSWLSFRKEVEKHAKLLDKLKLQDEVQAVDDARADYRKQTKSVDKLHKEVTACHQRAQGFYEQILQSAMAERPRGDKLPATCSQMLPELAAVKIALGKQVELENMLVLKRLAYAPYTSKHLVIHIPEDLNIDIATGDGIHRLASELAKQRGTRELELTPRDIQDSSSSWTRATLHLRLGHAAPAIPEETGIPVILASAYFEELFFESSPLEVQRSQHIFFGTIGACGLLVAITMSCVEFGKSSETLQHTAATSYELLIQNPTAGALPSDQLVFLPALVLLHGLSLTCIAAAGSDTTRCLSGFPWLPHYCYGVVQFLLRTYEIYLYKQISGPGVGLASALCLSGLGCLGALDFYTDVCFYYVMKHCAGLVTICGFEIWQISQCLLVVGVLIAQVLLPAARAFTYPGQRNLIMLKLLNFDLLADVYTPRTDFEEEADLDGWKKTKALVGFFLTLLRFSLEDGPQFWLQWRFVTSVGKSGLVQASLAIGILASAGGFAKSIYELCQKWHVAAADERNASNCCSDFLVFLRRVLLGRIALPHTDYQEACWQGSYEYDALGGSYIPQGFGKVVGLAGEIPAKHDASGLHITSSGDLPACHVSQGRLFPFFVKAALAMKAREWSVLRGMRDVDGCWEDLPRELVEKIEAEIAKAEAEAKAKADAEAKAKAEAEAKAKADAEAKARKHEWVCFGAGCFVD